MEESTKTGTGMPMSDIAHVACTQFAFVSGQAVAVIASSSAFALDCQILWAIDSIHPQRLS